MQNRIKQRVTVSLTSAQWAILKAEAFEQLRTVDDEVSILVIQWARGVENERNAKAAAEAAIAAKAAEERRMAERLAEHQRVLEEAAQPEPPPERPADFVELGEEALADRRPTRLFTDLDRYIRLGFVIENGNDAGYAGVYRNGAHRWRAMVNLERNGRRDKHTVGTYDSPEEAAVERAKFLEKEHRREEDDLLQQEIEGGSVLRAPLLIHPAYEAWIYDGFKEGVPRAPCPFQPGVRYTIDKRTMAVTRDEDGVVIVGPNVWAPRLRSVP
jgi:hypothetical protein